MPKQTNFDNKNASTHATRQRLILCLAVATSLCAVVLAFFVVPHLRDLHAFRREQAALPAASPFDQTWLDINPDYVGWLLIDGTIVDFPVVRGTDNVRYLTTTFGGEENIIGAIFMDYRNTNADPHIIIYGHEARDERGNPLMFGALHYFADPAHIAAFPTIIFMENDTMHEFEIFSARETDIHDPAYRLDFSADGAFDSFLARNGAPDCATQIITLSTCIGTDNDYRFLVQGSLVRSTPVRVTYSETGWDIEFLE